MLKKTLVALALISATVSTVNAGPVNDWVVKKHKAEIYRLLDAEKQGLAKGLTPAAGKPIATAVAGCTIDKLKARVKAIPPYLYHDAIVGEENKNRFLEQHLESAMMECARQWR